MPITGGEGKPHDTECALYWYVQTVNTSVQNGVLSQNITVTYFNAMARDTPDPFLQPPPTNGQNPRSYYVSPLSQLPLVAFLQETFTAKASFRSLPGSGLMQEEVDELTLSSSDVAQALWNTEDLDTLISNMANRLTDTLRNQFADPASSKPGEVLLTDLRFCTVALADPSHDAGDHIVWASLGFYRLEQ